METPKPGFLNLGLMTSGGQVIPRWVRDGWVVLCTRGCLSSISDFYLTATPPHTHT